MESKWEGLCWISSLIKWLSNGVTVKPCFINAANHLTSLLCWAEQNSAVSAKDLVGVTGCSCDLKDVLALTQKAFSVLN